MLRQIDFGALETEIEIEKIDGDPAIEDVLIKIRVQSNLMVSELTITEDEARKLQAALNEILS